MLSDLFIWLLGDFVAFMFGLMPDLPSPEGILGGVTGSIGSVFAAAASLSFWVPFGQAGLAVLVVSSVAVVCFGIKLVRIVASFLTLGGGSAA